ncbi:DUF4126 domain-containing protein [Candidatus Omnitrophota bacterium]
MDILNSLPLLLGGSWASGVNLYMTIAGLGISQRMGWIALPGNLDTLAHPLVIITAAGLYIVEFVADKIPYVDSTWDSIHTAIRPFGGAALGYMAMAGAGPALQIPVALLTGAVAADSHLTKATARVAINTSPEPFTNSLASVAEDASVATILFLIIQHPVIATIAVILFILFSFWFLKTMFRFLKKVFSWLFGGREEVKNTA